MFTHPLVLFKCIVQHIPMASPLTHNTKGTKLIQAGNMISVNLLHTQQDTHVEDGNKVNRK